MELPGFEIGTLSKCFHRKKKICNGAKRLCEMANKICCLLLFSEKGRTLRHCCQYLSPQTALHTIPAATAWAAPCTAASMAASGKISNHRQQMHDANQHRHHLVLNPNCGTFSYHFKHVLTKQGWVYPRHGQKTKNKMTWCCDRYLKLLMLD